MVLLVGFIHIGLLTLCAPLQDTFVAKVTRTVAKTNKLTKNKRRQWHSEESMFRVLNWSKSLWLRRHMQWCSHFNIG